MMSLSAVLAEIEASAEKIQGLESALATEKENGKTLVQQYREQSADALKILGINEAPERKPRSQHAVLMSAARRGIRLTVKGGEKNPKAILAAALAAADKTAKAKLDLAEVPADIKAKIEERVKNLAKK
jgi:imidazole glycerol phosphate synthase subunit HisF